MNKQIDIDQALCSCRTTHNETMPFGPWTLNDISDYKDSELPQKFVDEKIKLHCVDFYREGYEPVRAILEPHQYDSLKDQMDKGHPSLIKIGKYTEEGFEFIKSCRNSR